MADKEFAVVQILLHWKQNCFRRDKDVVSVC